MFNDYATPTQTVTFTRNRDTNSELVDGVYYNDNTNDLYVDLNDEVYMYFGVPSDVYDEFEKVIARGESVGRFYNTRIKRGGYGRATYVGNFDRVEFNEVGVQAAVASTDSIGTGSPAAGGSVHEYPKYGKIYPTEVVHISTRAPHFDLQPHKPAETVKCKHVVRFVVEGGDGTVREHTLEGGNNIMESVEKVHEIADMLDLSFDVKSVEVVLSE